MTSWHTHFGSKMSSFHLQTKQHDNFHQIVRNPNTQDKRNQDDKPALKNALTIPQATTPFRNVAMPNTCSKTTLDQIFPNQNQPGSHFLQTTPRTSIQNLHATHATKKDTFP